MLLNTENNLDARISAAQKELQRQKLQTWIEQAERNSQFIGDEDHDPTLAAKRIGKPLHHDVLETKLKKLNSSLIFVWNKFNSTKKCIFYGETHIPYEAGIMPERSIMSRHEEDVPVSDVYDNPNFVLNRKDLKADGTNAWTRKVITPWNEVTRGWRTVLLRLVQAGAITPQQAEISFGSHDSPEWQNSLGKAKHNLPW